MKIKVLFLQEVIPSYRIPVLREINKHVDLTVGFINPIKDLEFDTLRTIQLSAKKIGGIFFLKKGFFRLCKEFDIVIVLIDLHFVSFCALPFVKRKYKVIGWTLGFRASYARRYEVNRKKSIIDRIYGSVLKKCDALIFYMDAPISFWGDILKREKIFVAHNTVEVSYENIIKNCKKDRLLFVGSLYEEKKVFELVECFLKAKNLSQGELNLKLEIVGEGPEHKLLDTYIKENNQQEYIFLLGPVFDEVELAKFFSRALLCISPDQAGLSVLKSMGYGVPFVTRTNAITGGERLNIEDRVNGILYSTPEELMATILDASKNPDKYLSMGIRAREYYENNASIELMAKGIIDAIHYANKK